MITSLCAGVQCRMPLRFAVVLLFAGREPVQRFPMVKPLGRSEVSPAHLWLLTHLAIGNTGLLGAGRRGDNIKWLYSNKKFPPFISSPW